jgi:hypothetical protein
MRRLPRKLVLLAAALGQWAAGGGGLVGLLAATEASLRAIEHRESVTRSVKPTPPTQDSSREGVYRDQGTAE